MDTFPWRTSDAARLAAAMLQPPDAGPGLCDRCFDLIPLGYRYCRSCRRMPQELDVFVPVTLSVAGGPVHGALRGYKDAPDCTERDMLTSALTEIAGAFLDRHLACLAVAAGLPGVDVITSVPSTRGRRGHTRLRQLAIAQSEATATPYADLLAVQRTNAASRDYDPATFVATDALTGAAVLLIDDTWVTGARMRSAAAARTRTRSTAGPGATGRLPKRSEAALRG